jgi:hypothetical protein
MRAIAKIKNWLDGHGERPAVKIIGRAARREARRTFNEARRRIALGGSLGALAAAMLAENAREADAQTAQLRNPSPFAIVTRFNADPTGTNDSTNSFLAAEAGFPGSTYGGIVFMPPGSYKIGSTNNTGINFVRAGTSLIGSGCPVVGDSLLGPSMIDATGMSSKAPSANPVVSVLGGAQGNGGSRFEDFGIRMAFPLSGNHAAFYPEQALTGISVAGSYISMRQVTVYGGEVGFYLLDCFQGSFRSIDANDCAGWGIAIADSQALSFDQCQFQNSDYGGGAVIYARAASSEQTIPMSIKFRGFQDESFGWNGPIWFRDARSSGYQGGRLYNQNSTGGSGYVGCTVKFGGGGTGGGANYPGGDINTSNRLGTLNCFLRDVQIEPFASETESPAATVLLCPNSVGTILENVLTTPSNGGDIIDLGQNSRFRNVNGVDSIAVNTPTVTATLSGTVGTGDTITLTFTSVVLPYFNAPSSGSYSQGVESFTPTAVATAASGDTLTSLAAKLASAINANSTLAAANITATSASAVVTITQPGFAALNMTVSASTNHGGGGSEAVTFSPASGIPGSAAPSASNFVLSKTANKIPVGFIVDTVDSRLYFLGVDGNVHYIPYT